MKTLDPSTCNVITWLWKNVPYQHQQNSPSSVQDQSGRCKSSGRPAQGEVMSVKMQWPKRACPYLLKHFMNYSSKKPRVGQNHTYTVYIWYCWQGNHYVYSSHVRSWPTLKKTCCWRCKNRGRLPPRWNIYSGATTETARLLVLFGGIYILLIGVQPGVGTNHGMNQTPDDHMLWGLVYRSDALSSKNEGWS